MCLFFCITFCCYVKIKMYYKGKKNRSAIHLFNLRVMSGRKQLITAYHESSRVESAVAVEVAVGRSFSLNLQSEVATLLVLARSLSHAKGQLPQPCGRSGAEWHISHSHQLINWRLVALLIACSRKTLELHTAQQGAAVPPALPP